MTRAGTIERTQLIRDPLGMSLWLGSGGAIASSDPAVPVGCPNDWAVRIGPYDTGERRNADGLKEMPVGVPMKFLIEGWACSGTSVQGFGMTSFRYGTAYNNNPPNGYGSSTTLPGWPSGLSADEYRTWKKFRTIVQHTIPVGRSGKITVNWGVGSADWWVSGVTVTRL